MAAVVPEGVQGPEAESGTPPLEAQGGEVGDGLQQAQEGAADEEAAQPAAPSTPSPVEPPATPSRTASLRKKFSRKASSRVKKETAFGRFVVKIMGNVNVTSRPLVAVFRISVFTLLSFFLFFFVFYWPHVSTFSYVTGGESQTDYEEDTYGPYNVEASFGGREETVLLNVNDMFDDALAVSSPAMSEPVMLPTDDFEKDPGWFYEDIIGIERKTYAVNTCHFNADTGKCSADPENGPRMVQDLKVDCPFSGCVNPNTGEPGDYRNNMGDLARDYAAEPYGTNEGDLYLERSSFLMAFDPNYYNYYIADSEVKDHCGNFGMGELGDNPITNARPTSTNFLCNLGTRREKVKNILLDVRACAVQIQSTAGSDHSIFIRQKSEVGLDFDFDVQTRMNGETGCKERIIHVKAHGTSCPRPQVPGIDTTCDNFCQVILFKGENARHVKVQVTGGVETNVPMSSLTVNDCYLHMPNLTVVGTNVDVSLTQARIPEVTINTFDGEVNVKGLRVDDLEVATVTEDVTLEDSRDTQLFYRSASDFTCFVAPTVEAVPPEFSACDMRSKGNPDEAAHIHYDTVHDGYIDKNEFLEGIASLGLTFEGDSLDMDDEQVKRLVEHVFSVNNPHSAQQAMTYDLFQAQLETLAPYFTTLYDSAAKGDCFSSCKAEMEPWQCNSVCQWGCTDAVNQYFEADGEETYLTDTPGSGGPGIKSFSVSTIGITEPVFGKCDPTQGCQASCGAPDTSISGFADPEESKGEVNYHHYDVDPPDGVVTYEELRQALLKMYGNCTYVIEPEDKDYRTCKYVGGGMYDEVTHGQRRECKTYSGNSFDKNNAEWRVDNENLPPGTTRSKSEYGGAAPRECRPFPDYDPRLNGKRYDPEYSYSEHPEAFLLDGSRAPPEYYNRSTWSYENYNAVVNKMKDIFNEAAVGENFAYFNISSDDEYRLFASKLFSETIVAERVSYEQFNLNLQTLNRLDGVGNKYYLFNPNCFEASFLKVKPAKPAAPAGAGDPGAVPAAIQYTPSGSVEDLRMPGFMPYLHSGTVNACPGEWGTGIQGSTYFSYFAWADSTHGKKWGKALPAFCMDEAWATGGQKGSYPNEPRKYGDLAGKKIPPGCVPQRCYLKVHAESQQASIHAQTTPFSTAGSAGRAKYTEMISNCVDAETGAYTCFYKGYAAADDSRIRPLDLHKLESIKNEYAEEEADRHALVMFDVRGHGTPSHKKWFWASNEVYLQLEPAWLGAFSAYVLVPKMVHAKVKLSPGLCTPQYGAVEKIDWTDREAYGQTQEEIGLRLERESKTYQVLHNNIKPESEDELKGVFVLKDVGRGPYANETIVTSSVAARGEMDTDPGYVNEDGDIEGAGYYWRHQRLCVDSSCEEYVIVADNCLVQRSAVGPDADGKYAASACAFEDGSPAFVDHNLGSNSPSINDTLYQEQFPSWNDYSWEESSALLGEEVMQRNYFVTGKKYSQKTFTTYDYTKLRVEKTGMNVEFVDAQNWMVSNFAVLFVAFLSLFLGFQIALIAMAILALIGSKFIQNYNEEVRARKKIDSIKKVTKINKVFELLQAAKFRKRRSEAKSKGEPLDGIPQEDLELDEQERSDIQKFMISKGWTEQSDVGTWKVKSMKESYQEYVANGRPGKGKPAGVTSFRRGLTMKRPKIEPDPTAQGKGSDSQDAAKKKPAKKRKAPFMKLPYIPSLFEILDITVVAEIRKRFINSLKAFVMIKCVQNHPLQMNEEIRFGGDIETLAEYEPGKQIIRLGVGSEVGVSRSILGKIIRYRVKWVKIVNEPKEIMVDGEPVEILVPTIHEGPRTYIAKFIELKDWELALENPNPKKKELRSFSPPCGPKDGVQINFILKAAVGTRTIQIDTQSTQSTVKFKTILRNFHPMYEAFCIENHLDAKNILKSEATLKGLGVSVSKRLVEMVKGLRMKTDEDREREEEMEARRLARVAEREAMMAAEGSAPADAAAPVKLSMLSGAYGSGQANILDVADQNDGSNTAREGDRLMAVVDAASEATTSMDDVEEEEELDEIKTGFIYSSEKPFAKFLLSQYVITEDYSADWEDYAVFLLKYKKWCGRMKLPAEQIDIDDLGRCMVRHEEEPFFDMFGCTVNERDLSGNVRDSNIGIFYFLHFLAVVLHSFFLWLFPYPLIHAVMEMELFYSRSTAIKPQFTALDLRTKGPMETFSMPVPLENKLILALCFIWVIYGHIKLFIYYACYKYEKAWWQTLLKIIFYSYSMLLLTSVLSLLFTTIAWLVLGAVIKPDTFLPYTSGAATLIGHGKATYSRLMSAFHKYKDQLAAIIAMLFTFKIACAINQHKGLPKPLFNKETLKNVEPYTIFKNFAGEDEELALEEFEALLASLEVKLIPEKRKALFVQIDVSGDGVVNYQEFEQAWGILQEQIVDEQMQEAGMTKSKIMVLFTYAITLLILVFMFIFVGVAAFVKGGAFGSVVNSMMTAGAGGAMNSGEEEEEEEMDADEMDIDV